MSSICIFRHPCLLTGFLGEVSPAIGSLPGNWCRSGYHKKKKKYSSAAVVVAEPVIAVPESRRDSRVVKFRYFSFNFFYYYLLTNIVFWPRVLRSGIWDAQSRRLTFVPLHSSHSFRYHFSFLRQSLSHHSLSLDSRRSVSQSDCGCGTYSIRTIIEKSYSRRTPIKI